ncbi:hypothetical protein HanPI659440_Chr15g0598951 [Helianthus annuus]|nr:hypothetical protein HanPI659440_Chr15g0598951 [Helianthus annuus]
MSKRLISTTKPLLQTKRIQETKYQNEILQVKLNSSTVHQHDELLSLTNRSEQTYQDLNTRS